MEKLVVKEVGRRLVRKLDAWARVCCCPSIAPNPTGWPELVSAKDLTFRTSGSTPLEVKPMYRIRDEKYAVYWANQT